MWGRLAVAGGGDGIEAQVNRRRARFDAPPYPDAREWRENGRAGPRWAARNDLSAYSEREGETICFT